MYKVNKEKCTGCRACLGICPGATKMGPDGKAEIIDQEKLEQCGGESVCPLGAIEKIDEEEKPETEAPQTQPSPSGGRGLGRGRGFGQGRGRGRGGGRRW